MTDPAPRPHLLDDLAEVAGGAVSALSELGQGAAARGRARLDDTLRRLNLVRRDEMEAAVATLEARIAALEARLAKLEVENSPPGGGGPGIIT